MLLSNQENNGEHIPWNCSEVKPKNWKDIDDLIFEGLFDNIYRFWHQNSLDVLHVTFLQDTWSSKFIHLGFSLGVISFL